METIKYILQQAEAKHRVKILYACETGSRAWGFPSPDSDYDVRFIYCHERNWYLALNEKKDTIEFMDGDLDVTGWDLRKCLRLLKKSNVPLIERFGSPVQYRADERFKKDFKALIETYYSPTASFYHHYSLANKFWEELKEMNELKLKSWFYLVRSLLSCNWIVKDKTVLPMNIEPLMKYIGEDDCGRLQKLIALKATVGEKYLHLKDEAMQDFVLRLFRFIESSKDKLSVNRQDYSLLNGFFLKILNERAND